MTEGQPGSERFDSLYRVVYPIVVRSAYLIVLDLEVAREIAHETFLRLWERRDRLAPNSNEKAWLMRVATNLAISHRRTILTRLRRRPDPVAMPDPASLAHAQIERDEVRHALLTLRPRERAVLALRYEQDLSFAEIGSLVGRPEATVRTWLHRALEKMRSRLEAAAKRLPSQTERNAIDG